MRLVFLRLDDASKNEARVVRWHVHHFHQLESFLLGGFHDVHQIPNPPVRVPGFQAPIKVPREMVVGECAIVCRIVQDSKAQG